MTVLTKVKVSKREDEPALTQLVTGPEETEDDAQPQAPVDEVDAEAVRYRLLQQRARRINGSNLCALIALIAVIALCLLCGLFYYRHRVIYQNGRVHAWCSIPYEGETNNVDLLQEVPSEAQVFGQQAEPMTREGPRRRDPFGLEMLPKFHEEFDINVEENTEEMFAPRFARSDGARFIADFTLNKMALLPSNTRHCLIMALNREQFLEPEALASQVLRMEHGETLPEALTVTRQTLTVHAPAPQERAAFGTFELRACSGRPRILILRSLSVSKRSADEEMAPVRFSVFGGRGLIEYTIKNLPSLE